MSTIKAWAALEPGGKLQPFTYEMAPLTAEEVKIEVEYCGICHSDISFIKNELGNIPFPLVPGHEITGKIVALGDVAKQKGLHVGQKVGVGWYIESCMHCDSCLNGDQHLCKSNKATIWGNHGGYASHVKTNWLWAIPIPEEMNSADAGPLFCAGITVFSPLVEHGVKPTDCVGIFGIGGLGHLAIQFTHAWGCDVTAFSSSPSKYEEIKKLGANNIVSSKDTEEWQSLKGKFDLILITVNARLEWSKIIELLSPKGRLHFVGIVSDAIPVSVLSLLLPQTSISASPVGSRGVMNKMLRFAAHHKIKPVVEHFPMSHVNDAIEKIESGKAAYRVILDADFK